MVLGLSAATCLGFGTSAAPSNASQGQAAAAPTVFHRIIVKLRDPGSATLASAARTQHQSAPVAEAMAALAARNNLTLGNTRALLPGLQVMDIAPQAAGDALPAMLTRLRADPAVQYAEPDQRRYALAVPDDPLFVATPGATGQWYMQSPSSPAGAPSAVDATDAWTTTTGSAGLIIADIDTGVRFDHPDLLRAGAGVGGRLLPGYTFISDVLTANDGAVADADKNAVWDADASDPGDWITQADTQTSDFSQCTVGNSTWHGTRVVGILGAITNNSLGIAGLTWNGWILPVRALGKCGGADSDIETAMLWAAGMQVQDDTGGAVPLNPYPAQIINLSLGAAGSCPSSYLDVVEQLTAAGVTVVAAAGNEGGPVDAPGNCAGVIAVAGLRDVGTKVGFSSLGPQIALSAPGGNCVNTSGGPCLFSIDTTTNLGVTTPGANSYTNQSNYNVGTSFATPIVAGIAGLMLSVNHNLTPGQIAARLQQSVLPFPVSGSPSVPTCHVPMSSTDLQTAECSCTTLTCGSGMANASGAVNAALRPIAALNPPTSISAGHNAVFDASGSAAACTHSIASYAWSVINGSAMGSIVGSASGPTVTVVAPSSGSFTLQVTVTDDGGRTDSAQAVVSATAASTTAPASAGNAACFTPITPSLPITVTVSPSGTAVQAGPGTQAFTAAVTSTANTAVSWEVNGVAGGNATVGTITTAGLYSAPVNVPSSPTVSVNAVSLADATKTGFAGVTITPPVAVSVAPSSAVVLAGTGTQSFTATVVNAGSNTAVSWSVNGIAGGNSTVGTISSLGLYTAPATIPTPATVSVTAVSAADPTRSASATVTVAHVQVSVMPSVAMVAVGGKQPFVASVINTSNTAVTWKVNGAVGGTNAVGTISTSGVYTAPAIVPSPAMVTVTAVSVADATRSGDAQVTVTAASSSSSSSGASGGSHGGGGVMNAPSLLALAVLAATVIRARRRRAGPTGKSVERRALPATATATATAMAMALLGAAPAAHCAARWVAGVNYFLITPAQPTGLAAGKIEVTEIFSYACPGCNRFYPVAERLQASLPANAVMDYLPAAFRPDEDWPVFQRAYLAAKELGIDKRTHDALFDAIWKSGELAVFDPATQRAKRPAPTLTDLAKFYAKAAGVKPESFLATATSFAVDVKIRQADELIRNYGISETPSIVVNGKYRLNPVSAGGYEETIELVKWLVAQETRPGTSP
jgi:serine protease